MTLQEAQKLCRTNTGSNLVDSGCAYGYKYNAPLAKKLISRKDLLISLPHWLYYNFKSSKDSKKLTSRLMEFYKENNLIDAADKFLLDYFGDNYYKLFERNKEWENTYNLDNDLDQGFMYMIFPSANNINNNDNDDDDDCKYFAIISVHTGCDVRWGYTPPVILESSEYLEGMKLWGHCSECGKDFSSAYRIEESCRFKNGNWHHFHPPASGKINNKKDNYSDGKVIIFCSNNGE